MVRPASVRLPARTRLARALGSLASGASRRFAGGSGGAVGGRVLLAVDPGALAALARGRHLVVVSGTNGKTTTTRMITLALSTSHRVATNEGGDNLAQGLAVALARRSAADLTVLEVDELTLAKEGPALAPSVLVLLNLSRDQLDRVNEVRRIVPGWRAVLAAAPGATVVANADDPLVVEAALVHAQAGRRVVWVAAGQPWRVDATGCPVCGEPLTLSDGPWSCPSCGAQRPEPAWALDGADVVLPDGTRRTLALALPGRANRANAVTALAVAAEHGVEPDTALPALRTLTDVQGRYLRATVSGTSARLLLAKNPAGWLEALEQVAESDEQTVVLAVNARGVDGRDPSWLWDVPYEQLAGLRVVATGERADDLAVRLAYAGVDHEVVHDLPAALRLGGPSCDAVATYSAFQDLRALAGRA